MMDLRIAGTGVVVDGELVKHTFEQGSWPWLFDQMLLRVERERVTPLDPVLLFKPSGAGEPCLADGDTDELYEAVLNPALYTASIVSRRDGEMFCRLWPLNKETAEPTPTPDVNEPLKPMSRDVATKRREADTPRRRSPFESR